MENRITEQFYTIQGEGRSLGQPAYFIRFAGCNLWCGWCDSMHSVDPKQFQDKTREIDYSQVPEHCDLIVLTGGEPTLFDLETVRQKLARPGRRFEVESNATNFPKDIVDQYYWNLSPKLKSSAQRVPIADRNRLSRISDWANYARTHSTVTFKFVITGPEDLREVHELVREHRVKPSQVFLMPEGMTRQSQEHDAVGWIVDACKESGFLFSPRLHVIFWGNRRGV